MLAKGDARGHADQAEREGAAAIPAAGAREQSWTTGAQGDAAMAKALGSPVTEQPVMTAFIADQPPGGLK